MAELRRPQEAQATPEPRERYYHPAKIADWLTYWDALTSLAEQVGAIQLRATPASTRHLFGTNRHRDIQADILAAHDALGPTTREYRIAYLVMQGYSIEAAGDLLRPRLGLGGAWLVFWHACTEMAGFLGWRKGGE